MSRLRVARPPDSCKQPDGLAGVVGRAAAAAAAGDGVGSAEDECVPGEGFSWDLTGKVQGAIVLDSATCLQAVHISTHVFGAK